MTPKQERFEQALPHPFAMDAFVAFIRELPADVTMVAPEKFNKEYGNFSHHIAGYTHIGNYCGSSHIIWVY